MAKTGTLTKTLAMVGAILVWLPLLAPLLFGLARVARGAPLLIDWLMPAELFPVALLGGLLLLLAALRARTQRKAIGWGLAAAVVLLVGSQALAVATGLATGVTEPTGWPWALVVGSLAGYVLALVVVAVAGVMLVRETFRQH